MIVSIRRVEDDNTLEETRKPRDGKQAQSLKGERVTILLPKVLSERAKNSVYYTPADVTFRLLATMAMERGGRWLERKYNNGLSFTQRKSELEGGRPIKEQIVLRDREGHLAEKGKVQS